MKVAIIHDWLYVMRGAEKVLEVFCELYPDADLYCLFRVPGSVSEAIERMNIHTSFINRLPFVRKNHRWYLPLFPRAVEKFNLKDYDLVISSSHCVAKGVVVPKGTLHISYIYTPMRYIWDLYEDYFGKGRAGFFTRMIVPLFVKRLRKWDVRSCAGVSSFAAISDYVAQRVKKHYNRDADVIYPPVDTEKFQPSGKSSEDYYLVVSGLVPYKRTDIAVEAFNRLGHELRIIGIGPEERKLKKLARGNIKFLGWQPDEVLVRHYAGCKALIFPGREDFGIVPVEAMASGRPVIAYGVGGVTESVVPLQDKRGVSLPGPPTGIFFHEQSVDALCEAVRSFEQNAHRFDPAAVCERALEFDRKVFKTKIAAYIENQCRQSGMKP